jgi:hypothetical protein
MFSTNIGQQAWIRSSGRCECVRGTHRHFGRCNRPLAWERRAESGPGGWVAASKSGKFVKEVDDCEVICWFCNNSA